MSLLWTLRKLFQAPIQVEREQRDRIAYDLDERQSPDGAPPLFRCRVCACEEPSRAYCPACLADTMEPIPTSSAIVNGR